MSEPAYKIKRDGKNFYGLYRREIVPGIFGSHTAWFPSGVFQTLGKAEEDIKRRVEPALYYDAKGNRVESPN